MVEVFRRSVVNSGLMGAMSPRELHMVGHTKQDGFKMALQMLHNKGLIKITDESILNQRFTPLSSRFIGYAIGMSKMKTQPMYQEYIDSEGNKQRKKIREPLDVTILIFTKKLGWLHKFFNPPQMLALYDEDFESLNSDIIKVYDEAIMPNLYNIYACAKHFRDTGKVDELARDMIYRLTAEKNLQELKNWIDASVALHDKYRKQEAESIYRNIKSQTDQKEQK